MERVSALFRGTGWGLECPRETLADPEEIWAVPADRPDLLSPLLDWLDEIAMSGEPESFAVGFLTYEAGVFLEGSTSLFRPPDRTPLAWFGLFRRGATAVHELDRRIPGSPDRRLALAPRVSDLTLSEWCAGVESIRSAIARGDVYQVNLTRRFTSASRPLTGDLARALYRDNPVPFALAISTPDFRVVSNSPELFLSVDLLLGIAESGPIKGTIARVQRGDDAFQRERLLASAKDAAEHVMIVDLVRNDLGRVAVPGGVTVPTFRRLLTLEHLHHLESRVAARLRPRIRLGEILTAMLPAGSITGAPKRSALRLIRTLEPCARGPYTGAVGYVWGGGRAVFNVGIRTAIVAGDTVAYHAGGGIVWDSDGRDEWTETEVKSRELHAALRSLRQERCADPVMEGVQA